MSRPRPKRSQLSQPQVQIKCFYESLLDLVQERTRKQKVSQAFKLAIDNNLSLKEFQNQMFKIQPKEYERLM